MEVCAPDQVRRRIEEVANLEADLIAQHPIEARMH
jgi:tRNA isopentenyl-2-thiomethyl-A-37 hydroxylase MiaE